MSRGNKPKDTSVARLGTALVGAVAADAVIFYRWSSTIIGGCRFGAAAPSIFGFVSGVDKPQGSSELRTVIVNISGRVLFTSK